MLSAIFGGDIKSFLISFLLSLPIVLLSLSVHECAHGYLANRLGDPTAKSLGRLTLNPAKHIDPIGFICMALVGFGWAKPVPINTRYFKKPKRDMALCAAAGPLSNLLLAFVFAVLLRVEIYFIPTFFTSQLQANIFSLLYTFLFLGVRLNISLAVFNLIPIPPFDGSRILLTFLPSALYFKIMRYEQYIYIALMLLLLLGVLDGPINFVTNLFMEIILKAAFR